MENRAFAVCLAALRLPEQAEDAESLALLGEDSLHLLRRLHSFFQEKLVSSANAFRTAELIDRSILCCCLPEGMVMLRCQADATERTAALEGFLITKETLRTAWQLSRWKLLFVCAGGWARCGLVWLSPAEIEQLAMSLQAPSAMQEKLMDASRRMLASPVPFSFAVTGCPLHEIPVHFPGAAQEPSLTEAEQRGEIVFSPDQAAALTARLQSENSVFRSLRLHCTAPKQYQTLRLRHLAPFEDSAAVHAQLREELAGYPKDELWYFAVQVTDSLPYIRALRASVSEQLSAGTVDYADLAAETEAFTAGVYRFLEELRRSQEAAAAQKQVPPGETKPGGFLRSLFSKK